jgi:hypothetical protein
MIRSSDSGRVLNIVKAFIVFRSYALSKLQGLLCYKIGGVP